MLCLCEVGNSAGFQDKYGGESVNRWMEQVIHECCKTSFDFQALHATLHISLICAAEWMPNPKGR